MTLRGLGLGAEEAATYEWLVGRPSCAVEDLVPHLAPDVAEARALLRALRAQDLVTPSAEAPGRYVAAPPTVALGALTRARQDELARAEATVAELVTRYRAAAPGRALSDVIEAVTGTRAVAERFADLQGGAQDEVIAFVQADVLAVAGEDNAEEGRASARGVRYRVLVEREVLERPSFARDAEDLMTHGGEVRVLRTLPSRLVVADGTLGMLQLERQVEGVEPGALLVHASPLLRMLVELFESYWSRGAPLAPTEPDQPPDLLSPTDARILLLFRAGLTDRAVATQLGLSMRTVQRRVRLLMDLAGVDTRFRLGAEAVSRGWLD